MVRKIKNYILVSVKCKLCDLILLPSCDFYPPDVYVCETCEYSYHHNLRSEFISYEKLELEYNYNNKKLIIRPYFLSNNRENIIQTTIPQFTKQEAKIWLEKLKLIKLML